MSRAHCLVVVPELRTITVVGVGALPGLPPDSRGLPAVRVWSPGGGAVSLAVGGGRVSVGLLLRRVGLAPDRDVNERSEASARAHAHVSACGREVGGNWGPVGLSGVVGRLLRTVTVHPNRDTRMRTGQEGGSTADRHGPPDCAASQSVVHFGLRTVVVRSSRSGGIPLDAHRVHGRSAPPSRLDPVEQSVLVHQFVQMPPQNARVQPERDSDRTRTRADRDVAGCCRVPQREPKTDPLAGRGRKVRDASEPPRRPWRETGPHRDSPSDMEGRLGRGILWVSMLRYSAVQVRTGRLRRLVTLSPPAAGPRGRVRQAGSCRQSSTCPRRGTPPVPTE